MAHDGTLSFDTRILTDGAEKGLSKLAKGMKTGMSTAAKAVGLVGTALGGVASAAIKVGADYEAQMSRVKAISGATGAEFEKLNQQAKELGAATVFSASEAAEGMENLAAAGFSVNEITDAMPGLLDLAAASGEGLALSSEIAASTLRGFGLEAKDAAHVADVLAANANMTNAAVADTGEAMKYAAPIARALGISLEETAASIGIMSNAGIKGGQAGTTLRAALLRMTKPTKMVQDAMDDLGVSFFDTNGKMKSLSQISQELNAATKDMTDEQRNAALAAIFGQEALSGMLALVNAAPGELDKLTEAYVNSDGEAQKMAKTMQDNLKGAIEQLGGACETLGLEFYESVDSPLKDVVQKATGYIDQLTEAFRAGGLKGLVAEIGTVVSDLAVNIAKSAPKMISAAADVIKSFARGLKDNAGDIAAAAVDIMVTLADTLLSALPSIADAGAQIIATLADRLLGDDVGDAVNDLYKTIRQAFSDIAKSIKSALGDLKKPLGDLVKQIISIAKKIIPQLTKALQAVLKHADKLVPLLIKVYGAFKLWQILKTVTLNVKSFWGTLKNTAAALAMLPGKLKDSYTHMKNFASGAANLEGGLGKLLTKITGVSGAQSVMSAGMKVIPFTAMLAGIGLAMEGLGRLSLAFSEQAAAQKSIDESIANMTQTFQEVGEGAVAFIDGISSAKGVLDGFNESIIISSEEQAKLTEEINAVQGEISSIARAAADERRGYTDQEIQRLDDLFAKMRELTQREMEVGQAKQQAVLDAAEYAAQHKQISHDEAQSIISDATRTKDETLAKARETKYEQLALARQRCTENGVLNQELYDQEAAAIEAQYTQSVEGAQKIFDDTYNTTMNGYLATEEGLSGHIGKMCELQQRYNWEEALRNAELSKLHDERDAERKRKNGLTLAEEDSYAKRENEIRTRHKDNQARILEEMSENMKGAQDDGLKALLGMIADAESQGTELEGEIKDMADGVIDNLQTMPPEAQKTMDNVMRPMLETIKRGKTDIWDQATSLATGFISRINSIFKIGSPSRVMEDTWGWVMKGSERGVDGGKRALLKEADNISSGFIDKFKGMYSQMRSAVQAEMGRMTLDVSARAEYNAVRGNNVSNVDNHREGDIIIQAPVETAAEAAQRIRLERRLMARA